MCSQFKLVIHAGLIKTGSSFLQQVLFSNLGNKLNYTNSVGRINARDFFQTGTCVNLLSNENLLGHPLLCASYNKTYEEQFKTAILKAEKLFREPKWIIAFREPASFVKSVYKQHLHEWGTLDWNQFMDKHSTMIWEDLYFSNYVQFLNEKIHSERLLLINFDQLKKQPRLLLETILDFIGATTHRESQKLISNAVKVKSNVGVAEDMIPLLLRLNRISYIMYQNTGFRLAFSKGNIRYNPTILCREVLKGKLFQSNQVMVKPEQVEQIRVHYQEDWEKTKVLIND